MKLKSNVVLAAAFLSLGLGGAALAAGDHAGHGGTAAGAAAPAAAMTAGEVRKIDAEQGKVTIRHEPIANLDMPAMTMVFRAQSPELLKGLKVGDKIRFHAETVGGAILVTHIQPAT